ncbi:MAG: Oxidoreductase, short-chain dehydrogenase/reductase family [Myxococcaceae bacterium]|nr:Oxidoreductase, short-chain dehydrogenase/reductase family [Myxococcaceae bacterium]
MTTSASAGLSPSLSQRVLSTLRPGRSFSWRDKNVLITGGTRGLGLEIARVLVCKGANVAIVARDAAEMGRAIVDLEQTGAAQLPRVTGEICDLRDGRAIDAMLASVQTKLGPIDVLVNDAGIIQVGPLDAMTLEDFEDAMKLHFYAPLRTMLGLRASMRARGGGRVANISSIGGLVSVPHLLPYSASKFALVGLSQGMRAELARDNIRISTIAPGLMRTGSPRQALFKGNQQAEYAWFAISDSLPVLSMSSGRAARRIVRALERGEPHVVLGLPAKVAALASGVAPGLVTRALTVVNALLPLGVDPVAQKGYDSESKWAPSGLTALTERAATQNNER